MEDDRMEGVWVVLAITICVIASFGHTFKSYINFYRITSGVYSLTGTKVVDAARGEFPFIASLQDYDRNHFCSGTLITSQHIVTAGHCLSRRNPAEVLAILGETNSRVTIVRYIVSSWKIYRTWARRQNLIVSSEIDDLAIVTLMKSVSSRPEIRPIRLTDLNKQQVQGKAVTIIGWRNDDENGRRRKILVKATGKVLSDDECQRKRRLIINRNLQNSERMLCTDAQPNALLEDGDSGGPLLDGFGAFLGTHIADSPSTLYSWGNFSEDFYKEYKVNLHSNNAYQNYRLFISDVTGYN